MALAVVADSAGALPGELLPIAFDIAIGLVLALCLRGFCPEILIACLLEAIPGVGLIPSWSLAVPAIWARMKLGRSAESVGEPPMPRW